MSPWAAAGQREWSTRRRSRPGERGTRRKRLSWKAGSESRKKLIAREPKLNQKVCQTYDIHRLVRVTAHEWRPIKIAAIEGSPNNPRSVPSVMDLGLDRTPKCAGPRSGPLRVRIKARQRWMASTRVSSRTWLVRKEVRTAATSALTFVDLLLEALIERF